MSGKKKGNKGNAVSIVLREKLFERRKTSLEAIGDTGVGDVDRREERAWEAGVEPVVSALNQSQQI